jgi:hypothetical protein
LKVGAGARKSQLASRACSGGVSAVTIYYFSKDSRSTASDKPDGYFVKENSRTGLPFLTKKK